MANIAKSQRSASLRINRIEVTDDKLTSRAGLSPFVRYLDGINVFPTFEKLFCSIRKNKKSQKISSIFKQIICFLADGTSSHISYFDYLKNDEGYAAGIEATTTEMLSSHSVKRFFTKFSPIHYFIFRWLLQKLFIWRLNLEKPSVIILGVDTMVMDNDDAVLRQGVQPTYKKKKGFQPLQLNWKGYFVDAVFRGGSKHSNYGDSVQKMIIHVIKQIRRHYSVDVPIILRCDSGFFDQKLFELYEKDLGMGFICGGKLYEDIRKYVQNVPGESWPERLEDNDSEWSYLELGDRRKSWNRFRRAFFCILDIEDGQYLFDFAKPDSIIYTNIGLGDDIDRQLIQAGHEDMLKAASIIKCYHSRGNDELVNRAVKNFASEKLPFKQFRMNAAHYYTMLTAFFLLETFKHDTCEGIIPMSAYSTTIRRRLFDIAGKIVRHSGEIILKVTTAAMESLKLDVLWRRCNNPPLQFTWA